MDHEPTDNVRELQTVAVQLERLFVAAEQELEVVGPRLDIDFKTLADDFSAETQAARSDDPNHPRETRKVIAAEDKVRDLLEDMISPDTEIAIVAYEQLQQGSSIQRVVYRGWYCDVKPGNALENWDSAINHKTVEKTFAINEQGDKFLVPRLTLRIMDAEEAGRVAYVYIPFDKIVTAHLA
jgi:hypothetical protein